MSLAPFNDVKLPTSLTYAWVLFELWYNFPNSGRFVLFEEELVLIAVTRFCFSESPEYGFAISPEESRHCIEGRIGPRPGEKRRCCRRAASRALRTFEKSDRQKLHCSILCEPWSATWTFEKKGRLETIQNHTLSMKRYKGMQSLCRGMLQPGLRSAGGTLIVFNEIKVTHWWSFLAR